MKNEFIDQITEANKTAAKSFKALTDINVKAVRAFSEKQAEIFNIYLDASSQQVSLVADAKEADKLFNAQAALARTTGEKVVAVANSTKDIAESYKTELTSWVEDGVKTAKSAVKKAA